MRRQRMSSALRVEASAFATPLGGLHMGLLVVSLVGFFLAPEADDSFLPECLGTVLAFECAVVSARRASGYEASSLPRLRAESFTAGAVRVAARVATMSGAACVVTFLLPVVVLVVSPAQRDVLFLFAVLLLAILTARVMYLPVARWRARHRPAPGPLGRFVAFAARLYEESCRVLIPANAGPAQLGARAHPLRLLALLVRATVAVALAAVAVVLAGQFFAIPAVLPNSVAEEDLSAVTAQGPIVFPTMAIVVVLLVDGLQWLRELETGHELAATVHVIAVTVAMAVLADGFDDIISWASSLTTGLTGPSETAASVAVGTALGVVGALFFDAAQVLLSSVVFLTRPHRGVRRQETLFGPQWDTVRAPG